MQSIDCKAKYKLFLTKALERKRGGFNAISKSNIQGADLVPFEGMGQKKEKELLHKGRGKGVKPHGKH